jgi:hypothetical protein
MFSRYISESNGELKYEDKDKDKGIGNEMDREGWMVKLTECWSFCLR